MFSCTTAQHMYCTILYELYILQLNCTYTNYSKDAAKCSAAQQHSIFTVQILYKLYSLQLNCTYSNYTEAAATYSAAQEHSTFTVQILYKLYSLQLNCTYSNYTEAAATYSAPQHRKCPADVFWSAVQPTVWYYIYIHRHTYTVIRSFQTFKWLYTPCHQFTTLRNTSLCSRLANARRLTAQLVRPTAMT